jgi:homoserine dehydrogenase
MPTFDQVQTIESPPVAAGRVAIRVVLLGLGQVGSAVARLAARAADPSRPAVEVIGALVRHPGRRTGGVPLTDDPDLLLAAAPDVVVEVLGGTEPARRIVLAALERGIPVVTANKTLVATHGDELRAAAERGGTELRYEAAVIAGVPFLGTLARRPFAGACRRIEAVLNGTSNYVISKLERGAPDVASALIDAQRLGYAEPDPAKDVNGTDAAEKLTVLLRHLGGLNVAVDDIPTVGICGVTRSDLLQAQACGGTLKPVAWAEWERDQITAYVGPAFVPSTNPLAHLHSAGNGIRIHSTHAPAVFFAGAGAGPDATAATILDDVVECTSPTNAPLQACVTGRGGQVAPIDSVEWFVRLESPSPLPARDVADLFASYGVYARLSRESDRVQAPAACWLLTHSCSSDSVQSAVRSLRAATGCTASLWPSLTGTDD